MNKVKTMVIGAVIGSLGTTGVAVALEAKGMVTEPEAKITTYTPYEVEGCDTEDACRWDYEGGTWTLVVHRD